MAKIVIVENGREIEAEGRDGQSVMEVIKGTMQTDLLALCGGCCSCGTCHVFVDPGRLGDLPTMSDDEDALLDASSLRQPNSRLSCQLPCSKALDGLRVEIAPPG